ncbi:phosphatase PAP2 family protein [Candidatus Saccharibacteria bacterium]|nr:phosphatase PAP2 family protein [Candidatus Saccharibacteria bacterium]
MEFLIILLADYLVAPILLLAAWAVLRLPAKKRWQAIARGVVVALTALLFAKIIAQFYQGERPFETMGIKPGASYLPNPGFPSDHSLLVFTTVIVTYAATQRRRLGIALLTMAVLVALGRVLAHVHTPLDVIGGALCAALAGVLWYGHRFRQAYGTPGVQAKSKTTVTKSTRSKRSS